MRVTKKRVALAAVTAAVVTAGSGTALAFWTVGGSGTGAATSGTAAPVTVTAAPATGAAALVPDGATQDGLVLTVTNPNRFSTQLVGHTASIVANSITCTKPGSSTAAPAADAWFTLTGAGSGGAATIGGSTTVAALAGGAATGNPPAATVSDSGLALTMNDSADNQDVCQGAAVAFRLKIS